MKDFSSQGAVAGALLVTSLVLGTVACSDQKSASFMGKAGKLKVQPATESVVQVPEGAAVPVATPREAPTSRPDLAVAQETAAPTEVSGETKFTVQASNYRTSVNNAEVWAVNGAGNAFRVQLDEARGFPVSTWSIPANWGNRTYVSEIGLIIGQSVRSGMGGILRVSDDVPNTHQSIITAAELGADTESRFCVTSFRVGTQAYVGAAYYAGSKPWFLRIPIDKSKPNKVDVSRMEKVNISSTPGYAYSCFIDQSRNRFWVGWSGGTLWGVDVAAMQPLPASAAANYGHVPSHLTIDWSKSNSYALAGDGYGNLLHGVMPGANIYYTMAHDPVADVVFGRVYGGPFTVTKGECFRTTSDCSGKTFTFPLPAGANIGPMSSLNDGRIAMLTRANPTEIFLASVIDPADISKGVTFRKVADLSGDPYMYTDFTGATMYAATVERAVSLSEVTGFRTGVSVKEIKFRWQAESGREEDWRGLKLSMRCWASSQANKPAYVEVATVPKAGVWGSLGVPSCADSVVDALDVRTEPGSNGVVFSRTRSFEFEVTQK